MEACIIKEINKYDCFTTHKMEISQIKEVRFDGKKVIIRVCALDEDKPFEEVEFVMDEVDLSGFITIKKEETQTKSVTLTLEGNVYSNNCGSYFTYEFL